MEQQQYPQPHEDNMISSTSVGGAGCKSSSTCRQSSTRWNPTNEQKRILWDLYYNCGVRSPSAELIQKISAKLRQYGKIEGKNVFYWFQNHKARERQKRRLTLDMIPSSSSSSTTTTMPPGLYYGTSTAGEMGSSGSGGSLLMERGYRDCFMVGGRDEEAAATESNMGWVLGLEMPSPMCPCNGEIETLPLFPIHAQAQQKDYDQQVEQTERSLATHSHIPIATKKAEPLNGCFPSFYWGGGGGDGQQQEEEQHLLHSKSYGTVVPHQSSLELTLNSYCYPSPGSM